MGIFALANGGEIETLDGNAKFYTKNGTVHELCESDISCAAFTVDGPGEAKRLLEEADMALKNAKAKRRLALNCKTAQTIHKTTVHLCHNYVKNHNPGTVEYGARYDANKDGKVFIHVGDSFIEDLPELGGLLEQVCF